MKGLVVFLLALVLADAIEVREASDGYCSYKKKALAQRPHSVTITEFGAVGDGVTLNTVAFQNAVFYLRSFADKGGAQLYVPKGIWLTGSFSLISHLTLFLDKGAVIIGTKDVSQYLVVEPLPSYGRGIELPGGRYQSLINVNNLTDVVITGDNGTIDGEGSVWWDSFRSHTLNYSRPHLVELVHSDDVLISNLTFLNPPAWAIHPVYCRNVEIQNVTINAPPDSPFTDGIVPDSSTGVCIEESSISVGHDGISLKSGWDEYGISYSRPTSNVHITKVSLRAPLGSALSIGSEMSGGVSAVRADHLRIHDSGVGIGFSTSRGRGGFVEDILVSDVEMRRVLTAIRFSGSDDRHPDENYDPDALPVVRLVTIRNVIGTDVLAAGALTGIVHDPFTAICLANINMTAAPAGASSTDPWTCSDVWGFSEDVFPEPCPELQVRITNSTPACYSVDDRNEYTLVASE